MSTSLKKGDGDIKAVPCEVWSRVVGYYRPVSSWNEGKREEYRDRAVFSPDDLTALPLIESDDYGEAS